MISVRYIRSMLFYLAFVLLSNLYIFLKYLLGYAIILWHSLCCSSASPYYLYYLTNLILINSSKMSCTQNVDRVIATMYTNKIHTLYIRPIISLNTRYKPCNPRFEVCYSCCSPTPTSLVD